MSQDDVRPTLIVYKSDMVGQGPSGDIWHRRRRHCCRCRGGGKGDDKKGGKVIGTEFKSIDFL